MSGWKQEVMPPKTIKLEFNNKLIDMHKNMRLRINDKYYKVTRKRLNKLWAVEIPPNSNITQ